MALTRQILGFIYIPQTELAPSEHISMQTPELANTHLQLHQQLSTHQVTKTKPF